MKTSNIFFGAVGVCLFASTTLASNVADSDIVTFTPNATAKAAEVNQNFTVIKNSVNSKVDKTGDTITGPLTINGTVTAQTFVYATPQAGQIFASPTQCIRSSGDLHLEMSTLSPPANTYGPSILSTNTAASTSFTYFCPVPIQVPPGSTVTITGASMAYYDGGSNCRVQGEVRYKTFGTLDNGSIKTTAYSGTDVSDFATTSTGPTTTGFPSFTLAVPSNLIVWVNAIIAFNATGGGDCRYSGTLVDYTVSNP